MLAGDGKVAQNAWKHPYTMDDVFDRNNVNYITTHYATAQEGLRISHQHIVDPLRS